MAGLASVYTEGFSVEEIEHYFQTESTIFMWGMVAVAVALFVKTDYGCS